MRIINGGVKNKIDRSVANVSLLSPWFKTNGLIFVSGTQEVLSSSVKGEREESIQDLRFSRPLLSDLFDGGSILLKVP